MSEEKLKIAVARINELRFRLEPVEQHWAWTAEQLHRELRHVLHTLNGLVSYLASNPVEEAGGPRPVDESSPGAGCGAPDPPVSPR